MTLNKAKGRMFKSVGWTWNPIAGCSHKCEYCWAESLRKRWGKGFKPELRKKFLKDKMPNDGSWIFVGSMGDTFCDEVPNDWIKKLFQYIEDYEGNNKFLLMTKNPMRFCEWTGTLKELKDKIILGTTIETDDFTSEWSEAPPTIERMHALRFMKQAFGHKTFLSMEPLSAFSLDRMTHWIEQIDPEAIEIGLENYTRYTRKPTEKAIKQLLYWLYDNKYEYVLKENLEHIIVPPKQSEIDTLKVPNDILKVSVKFDLINETDDLYNVSDCSKKHQTDTSKQSDKGMTITCPGCNTSSTWTMFGSDWKCSTCKEWHYWWGAGWTKEGESPTFHSLPRTKKGESE